MSRNRKEVISIFDVFCEVGATVDGNGAVILQKYPDDYNDERVLKSVAQFSFPCGVDDDDVEAVQLFSFVLTDEKSQYTYAFCRHTPRNNTCICILSGLPWVSTFYKILNQISTIMNNELLDVFEAFLTRLYHSAVPYPGETLVIESYSKSGNLEILISDKNKLPTLKDDKFMLEFYNAVPEKQMVTLYASLLKERRILFTGRKLGQLSSCIFAAAALLYPMQWQNLFIPVLPSGIVEMLMAPMPYLIGVPKKTLKSVKIVELGDVMIIDLDEHSLQCMHNDVADMPSEIISLLQNQLRSNPDMFVSDSLARAFLRTNVQLFGDYRKGMICSSLKYTWDREKFIQSQKAGLQPYLRSLLGQDGVQYLERFIDERVAALNSGAPIDDEFENEIRLSEDRATKANLVRENASDVFGILKDKMQSITLDRLSRLNPKEIRRFSPRKSSNIDSPMSFDTQQWLNERTESLDKESQNADTPDLIDLSDEPCVATTPTLSAVSTSQELNNDTPSSKQGTASVIIDRQLSNNSKSYDGVKDQMRKWQRFD